VGHRAGLDVGEKRKFLTLPGLELQPLGHPAHSQLLYRLLYVFRSSTDFSQKRFSHDNEQIDVICAWFGAKVFFFYFGRIMFLKFEWYKCISQKRDNFLKNKA
jgi:hypothetical protein